MAAIWITRGGPSGSRARCASACAGPWRQAAGARGRAAPDCGFLGRGREPRYHHARMRGPIRILGIDPGLRRTGWGVVDVAGNRLSYVACGSVETDDRAGLAQRLVAIHEG